MKKLLFSILLLFISTIAFSQERKMKLGFSTNYYTSTDYDIVKAGVGLSLDMNYIVGKHLILGAHMQYGSFRYHYPNPDPFDQNDDLNTNSRANPIHAGLVFGYNKQFNEKISAFAFTGFTSFTYVRMEPEQTDYGTAYITKAFTDLAFPVRIGVDFKAADYLSIGLVAGAYIEPDFPIVGWHFGPSMNYWFK